jgi:small ligand-binding sensory domain FIST
MEHLFASAIAEGQDWADVAKNCLHQLDVVPGANLGILYVSDHLADQIGSIATLFRGVTGVENWVGSVGIGVCGTNAEVFDRPAISVLIGHWPENGFRLFPALTDGLGPLEQTAGTWMSLHPPQLTLVHGDPRTPRLIPVLNGLADRVGFLVGGLAASRGEFPTLANRVFESGLSGVMFSSAVGVATGLTQGCSPVGPLRTITAAEDNMAMEIDGRPALEVFKQDIGELLSRDLRKVGGLIFAGFPVTGSDTGDYLVRNLNGIDTQKGWLSLGEDVTAGRRILFVRRDPVAAQADLERMLNQLKRRLSGPPKAGLYCSCVARGPNLFGHDSEELKTIGRILGNFPLTGVFANGEISNNRLYGYTGVLTLFT